MGLTAKFKKTKGKFTYMDLSEAGKNKVGRAKDKLYFGLEIEMERTNKWAGMLFTSRDDIHKTKVPNFIYLDTDGTLHNSGVEAKTVPCSWNFLMKHRTQAIMKKWLSQCQTQHFSTTNATGLHIHLSKNAFTGNNHIYRFCRFIYANRAFSLRIGRRKTTRGNERTPSSYCQYDSRFDCQQALSDAVESGSSSHSHAINFYRSETVEVRIFKGIISYSHIYSSIEFCGALYYFTKQYTLSDDYNSVENFTKYVLDNQAKFPNLTRSLLTKRKAM